MKRLFAILIYGVLVSHAAYAQQVPGAVDDPVANARFRFGVVAFDPRIALQNVGVDTNVFNSATNKQRDFTLTIVPGTKVYMRTGKGLLTLDGHLDLVHFQKFETERSINSAVTGQYEFRFNRLRPYVSAGSINSRERPGYEIDVRARHYETDLHAGADLRVASKSTLRLDVRHLDYSFDGDAVFNGRPLNQELSRTLEAVDLSWRQRLTALTTWVTRITRESERFELSKIRNSDSFGVNSGFELGRYALIRGSAFAGYRKLHGADGGVLPEFAGVTADVNVSYAAPTQTRVGAMVNRDIQYSLNSAREKGSLAVTPLVPYLRYADPKPTTPPQ